VSIKTKLVTLLTLLVALLMMMGSLSWYAMSSLTEKTETIIELTNVRSEFNKMMQFTRANREQIMLALQHNPSNPIIASMHDHAPSMHFDNIDNNRKKSAASLKLLGEMSVAQRLVGKEMERLQAVRSMQTNALNDVMQLLKTEQYDQANKLLLTSMNPAFAKLLITADEVFKVVNDTIQHEEQASVALSNQLSLLTMGMMLLSVLLAIVAGSLIVRSIGNAINDTIRAVATVIQSKTFKTQLPARSDEFSGLNRELNMLFSDLDVAIQEANHVIGAIANADFSQRMSRQYSGDLEVMKQGVNASAVSVAFMMDELEKVMNGLNAGKFDMRMDAKVPQAFRNLVEQALNNVSIVIADIASVMKQMNDGDFNARVQVAAQGDLLTIKNTINGSMDAVSAAVASISDVVAAQAAGDLTKELPGNAFRGQLHDLKNAINYSSAKVKDIVVQAMASSHIVNDASAQVSQGSSDLSARVQEQAAALEQTSATMNEMSSAVQANTANARKVADLAVAVQKQSVEGADVMHQTIGAMQSIRESSHKISDIVTLIDGIAFQTNLLALNAAVEAARAGEHGRGFAVVAGEVRALAQKSADAAKDIKGLIGDSVTRVENGTHLAEKSGAMLGGITQSVTQVAGMIEEIARASDEQSVGIGQVHLAIAQIDSVTQQNAALVEETTAAAESLKIEAEGLSRNMSFFNTGVVQHHAVAAKSVAKPAAKPMLATKKSVALPAPAKGNADEWSDF